MTIKVVSTLKYFGILSVVFFTIISCEKEIENVGVNLIDTNNFDTNVLISEVLSTNKKVEKVPANTLSQYLLGVYKNEEFGKLEASMVTQLVLPAFGETYSSGYGENTAIDSVIISIPYQSTKELENNTNGTPKFKIDSVFGNADVPFKLNIFELKTFLNTLDPQDPAKNAVYYSNKEFQKGDIPFFSGNFKVNPNDTVSYIKRYLQDGKTVYYTDTIKQTNVVPTIKIPLNEALVSQFFIENASNPAFLTSDSFNHYFRGFYIEASEISTEKSHILSLNMADAKMTIYYSMNEDEDADQDLNKNGTNGEKGVRTRHTYNFNFGILKSNVFKRDYSNSEKSGADRLYVQGAAGSMSVLELFSNEDINEIRNKNWLITDANLTFYIDQNASTSEVPNKLFIYNYDKNLQLTDMLTEGIGTVGGNLVKDENDKPYKYVFKITDYISELLRSNEPLELVKIGLKVYNPTDAPTSLTDTAIRNFSWNPKGVVLYNHNASAGEKRIKLQVSYSKLNN